MTPKRSKPGPTLLLALALLAAESLAWSKCKSGNCKSCTYRGCEKCRNQWVNLNWDCQDFSVTNTANCLSFNTTSNRCLTCGEGFYIASDGTCSALGSTDCAAGVFVNNTLKCTSCLNGKYATNTGECAQAIPAGSTTGVWAHCVNANMTYSGTLGENVVQTCAECDYGYSLNATGGCSISCAEGCLRCNADNVCVECNWRKGWWSTSPNNCTNPNFNWYKEWNAHEGKVLRVAAVLVGALAGLAFLG